MKEKKNKNKKKEITNRPRRISGIRRNKAGAAKFRHPTSDMRNALLETPQTAIARNRRHK
jgi:hypothetical protein